MTREKAIIVETRESQASKACEEGGNRKITAE
jgi:hypothetical protein